MTARKSVAFIPSGETPTQMADKTRIVDQHLLQEYTPTSASDATAPQVRFAYGYDYGLTSGTFYLHVQTATGVWKKAALS